MFTRLLDAIRGADVPTEAVRSGSLAASTTETVLDTTTPCVIDNLQLASNYENARIYIDRKDAANNNIGMSRVYCNGSSTDAFWDISYLWLTGGTGQMAMFTRVSNISGSYMISLAPGAEIKCPFGCRIRVSNPDAGGAHNVAAVVGIRKI